MYGGNKFHVHYVALLTQAKQYAQKVNPKKKPHTKAKKGRCLHMILHTVKNYFSYWSSGHH